MLFFPYGIPSRTGILNTVSFQRTYCVLGNCYVCSLSASGPKRKGIPMGKKNNCRKIITYPLDNIPPRVIV